MTSRSALSGSALRYLGFVAKQTEIDHEPDSVKGEYSPSQAPALPEGEPRCPKHEAQCRHCGKKFSQYPAPAEPLTAEQLDDYLQSFNAKYPEIHSRQRRLAAIKDFARQVRQEGEWCESCEDWKQAYMAKRADIARLKAELNALRHQRYENIPEFRFRGKTADELTLIIANAERAEAERDALKQAKADERAMMNLELLKAQTDRKRAEAALREAPKPHTDENGVLWWYGIGYTSCFQRNQSVREARGKALDEAAKAAICSDEIMQAILALKDADGSERPAEESKEKQS